MNSNFTSCNGYLAFNVCIPEASCRYFMDIPTEHQCEFVKMVDDCIDDGAYVQYMEIYACNIGASQSVYYTLYYIFAEMLLCFISLGSSTDRFFAPALCAVANVLRLSENVAGVTLLAFGNASPDILTSLISAQDYGPEFIVCQLLGGGIFVTSIVAALILFAQQFHAHPAIFLRDTTVYFLGVIWLFILIEDNVVDLYEPVVLVVMYCIYVILVFFQAWSTTKVERETYMDIFDDLYQNENRYQSIDLTSPIQGSSNLLHSSDRLSPGETPSRVIDVRKRFKSPHHDDTFLPIPVRSKRFSTLSQGSRSHSASLVPSEDFSLRRPPREKAVPEMLSFVKLYIDAERISSLSRSGMSSEAESQMEGYPDTTDIYEGEDVGYEKPMGLLADLFHNLNPIDEEEWESSSSVSRIFILIYAPSVYLFKIFIPIVDHGALNNGWCKLLNTFHCLICPLFSAFVFGIFNSNANVYIPITAVISIIGLCLMYIVFNSSKVGQAPPYHFVYSIAAFILSMQLIYIIANNLVFLLRITGAILQIEVTTLAMTILAWGNSMGDLIADTALARAGYPLMAWAGVFGGPTMSVLLGAGASLILLISRKGENLRLKFEPKLRGVIANCFFYLGCSLLSSILIIQLLNFQCRRSYGMYLLVLYVMFIIFVVLSEKKIIHPLR